MTLPEMHLKTLYKGNPGKGIFTVDLNNTQMYNNRKDRTMDCQKVMINIKSNLHDYLKSNDLKSIVVGVSEGIAP